MVYYYFQSLETMTWISTGKRKNLIFKSNLVDSLTEGMHLYATHKVYSGDERLLEAYGVKAGDCISEVSNGEVPKIIKDYGLKFVGFRLGWTGWQRGLDNNDRKCFVDKLMSGLLDGRWHSDL